MKEKNLRLMNYENKILFYLAYFDTDFLNGKVKLISGDEIDLSDFVKYENGKYYLKKNISERDCNRLIAEMYLVLSNIIPIHKSLLYNFENNSGQIEVSTTPYYHPILPLIYNSDEAKTSQPNDKLPNKFSYKEDAKYHIEKQLRFTKIILELHRVECGPEKEQSLTMLPQ